MYFQKILVLLLSSHFGNVIKCDNILGIFPYPMASHQWVFQPIWKELSLRGHNVTIATPNPLNESFLINLTEIDLGSVREILKAITISPATNSGTGFLRNSYNIVTLSRKSYLENVELSALLTNKDIKFDLIILQYLDPFWFILGHIFKAPVVALTSFSGPNLLYRHFGKLNHPVLYSDMMFKPYTRDTPVLENIIKIYENFWVNYFFDFVITPNANEEIKKKFGSASMYVEDLEKELCVYFNNRNSILQYPRPNVPGIVETLPILPITYQPLPQKLQTILDNATNGIIFISFGSNLKSSIFSENAVQEINKAVSDLPYLVLWKWDNEHLPNQPKNVIIQKWFPQSDLLAHPNIKLFITHGGLRSFQEAVFAEVPMIGIPFVIDQPLNVERIVQLGIGQKIEYKNLTAKYLKEVILDITSSKTYKLNIKKVKSQVFDRPFGSGLNSIVWWIEYTMRHKKCSFLKSREAQTSWFDYFLLDVLLCFLVFFSLFICLIVYIFKLLLYRI